MALTAEAEKRIMAKMEKLQRQKTRQQITDEMCKLQEFVDKSEMDAFVGCLYFHGGGFFYVGEYFIGMVTLLLGYAVTLYGVWLGISSALSYVWDFERCWMAALWWIVGGVAYDVVLGVIAAVMAHNIRERSRFALDILRERSRKIGA